MRRRRTRSEVVGLDIQAGEAVAAVARRDGAGVRVERAAATALAPSLVRDGDVVDAPALAVQLRALFAEHELGPRVRVGLTGARALMRILDLPPLQDPDDVAAAVRVQAPEHIAMPLAGAVLDHHALGIVETPEGPRTRVVVAAAPRDAVERLLDALARARLRPVGIDLGAFALVRGLAGRRAGEDPVLYAHASGVTTLAVAHGARCQLTRVATVGLELLAGRLAERGGVVLEAARSRLLAYAPGGEDAEALAVLDQGLAELAEELRTTAAFHDASSGGAPVAEILLSGPLATIPGVLDVLAERVGTPVRAAAPDGSHGAVAPTLTAVAAGLSVEEVRP